MFKTHLALGFLIGFVVAALFNVVYPVLFVILVTLLSALPDIDHPKSKYGRKLFFISIPISLFFKHRGFFHSIFPPAILALIFVYFNLNYLALAVFVGYVSHLIGDATTKEGINFLHPFATFRVQGPLTTGGLLEKVIFFGLILVNLLLSYSFLSYYFKLFF